MTEPTRHPLLSVLIIAVLVVAVLAAAGFYVKRQGYFDPPLVRFARAMSANDAVSVEFAKALLADRNAAWKIPWFDEALGWQFEPDDLPDAVAIVHAMSEQGLPHMADFDWKEGGENVADAFEEMLDHYGLPQPDDAQRQAILAEAEKLGPDYTQIPILIVRYGEYFRRHGYVLAHLNIDSDSYQFVALPPVTARCWMNVSLKAEPGRQYDSTVHIEDAILQSAEYVAKHVPELRHLTPDRLPKKTPPASACLPWRALLP